MCTVCYARDKTAEAIQSELGSWEQLRHPFPFSLSLSLPRPAPPWSFPGIPWWFTGTGTSTYDHVKLNGVLTHAPFSTTLLHGSTCDTMRGTSAYGKVIVLGSWEGREFLLASFPSIPQLCSFPSWFAINCTLSCTISRGICPRCFFPLIPLVRNWIRSILYLFRWK